MTEPRPDRPHVPGYGILTSTDGLLPWSWAVERLEAANATTVLRARPRRWPLVNANRQQEPARSSIAPAATPTA